VSLSLKTSEFLLSKNTDLSKEVDKDTIEPIVATGVLQTTGVVVLVLF
jgi:hypothetical protein